VVVVVAMKVGVDAVIADVVTKLQNAIV